MNGESTKNLNVFANYLFDICKSYT